MKTVNHMSRVYGAPVPRVFVTDTISGRHFGRHWHDVFGFGFLEQGAQSWRSGRGQVRAYAGDVICTNPGEVHDGQPLGAPARSWRIVSVDVDVMAALTGQAGHVEIARPVIEDQNLMRALARLFERLGRWQASRQPDGADALACEESLVETCTLLLARHGSAPSSAKAPGADMRGVRDRLADDTRDVPTLADLGAMTGLSRYQVLRRFEKAYGMPPHAWLKSQRAERARGLIRLGATLAAAAAASGFSDQSHMTRLFARHYGYTPGAWQKAALQ